MEKLYSVKKIGLILGLLFCFSGLYSQNNLVVFKVEGSPLMKVNDSLKTLRKGSLVRPDAVVRLKDDDRLLLINNEGTCYEINTKKEYMYTDITNSPVAEDNSSFTKKYFTYIWNEFIQSKEAKTQTGVVFRNDKIILLQPSDNVRIHIPEITFVWNIDSETSFFLLRDVENDHITKFGVSGNYLTLFVDNEVLQQGKTYQWAVSDKKFPNLVEVDYYNFSLLSAESFNELKPDIEQFKKELSALGFSSKEVKAMLCNDYKICY